jgi:hypothetical protein
MAQRILEPGEIETLASRDVPRIILPDTASLFADARRACAAWPRTVPSAATCSCWRRWPMHSRRCWMS